MIKLTRIFLTCGVVIMGKKFIETPRFPFDEVSEASAIEKGPGRPPH